MLCVLFANITSKINSIQFVSEPAVSQPIHDK